MRVVLLSNRCVVYINLERYDKVKEDVERCVQVEFQWFKVCKGKVLCDVNVYN